MLNLGGFFGDNTIVILIIAYLLLSNGGCGMDFLQDNLILVAVLAYLILSDGGCGGLKFLGAK